MSDPNARHAATIPADCRSSPIPQPLTSYPGKTPHLWNGARLSQNRCPRRLCDCRSERMGRPRHQNVNQRSRQGHRSAGKAARSHPLCRKGAALIHEDTCSRFPITIQRKRSTRAISRQLSSCGSKSASRTAFGLVGPFRRRFWTAIDVSYHFLPGSIFAFVRWTSNDFGTVLSRVDILRAARPGQRYSTFPWITPGGESLLRLSGWSKVERVLQLIDAVEALGIDPADAAPDYWHHVHNRLSVNETPRPYTRSRHQAWLHRRKVTS